MKIEVGKFYRTRDGQKVGPMEENDDGDYGEYTFIGALGAANLTFTADGFYIVPEQEYDFDLIAEWVDEPVVGVAADHQPVMLFPAPNGGWVVHGNEGDVIGAYTTSAEMIAALSMALGVTK